MFLLITVIRMMMIMMMMMIVMKRMMMMVDRRNFLMETNVKKDKVTYVNYLTVKSKYNIINDET